MHAQEPHAEKKELILIRSKLKRIGRKMAGKKIIWLEWMLRWKIWRRNRTEADGKDNQGKDGKQEGGRRQTTARWV
jgi:hypothetical protein